MNSSLLAPLLLLAMVPLASAQAPLGARVETAPVPTSGDAADDPAIWVHPTNPSLSVVIGTDKESGLAVYDLAGNQLQFLPDGEPNNVDLRRNFVLGGQEVTLVTASDRASNRLAAYVLDPVTRTLSDVTARDITLGIEVYGSCLYQSPFTQRFYFFCTSKDGPVEQWRLFDDGSGRVNALHVRTFDVGGQCEGCVADDGTGYVFIGEETEGVWRYGAEPTAGTGRVLVDSTDGGHLEADVEGLSIYYASGGRGYLLVSSQGDNSFAVYDRQAPHAFLSSFTIVANAGNGIDGVTDCDGIDVTNLGLGSAFPGGLFVAQDGSNTGGNQNFKFLDWRDVAAAANPPLIVDSLYDPYRCPDLASFAYRDGANPPILVNQSLPRLGSSWRIDLDCSGHASGVALVFGYARPGSGIFTGAGEVLIDPQSARLFRVGAQHLGGTATFDLTVPLDLVFCGMPAHVQGSCWGAPARELSNAIDIVLGF